MANYTFILSLELSRLWLSPSGIIRGNFSIALKRNWRAKKGNK